MTTVSFDLESAKQEVILKTDIVNESWFRVRRVFSNDTDHVELAGESEIKIPLWLFLSHREALAFRLDAENIDFHFGDTLSKLLDNVVTQSLEYDALAQAPSLTIARLKTLLAAAGFDRSLKSYQSRNVRKLLRYSAAATFSVPGAGKTSEGLAYFAASSTVKEKLLVIAPKNAFAAWEEQLRICFPSKTYRFRRLTGGRAQIQAVLATSPKFLIISYRQLQTVLSDVIAFLSKSRTAIFLDESHRMKGGLARETGRTVLALSGMPTRKLLLSGTPMPNSQSDLVAQAQFLFPFKQIDESNAQQLITPVYARTTKDELGLRPPDRIARLVPMSAAQRSFYELLAHEEARRISSLNRSDRIQLRAIGRSVVRLIQVSSNPLLLINKVDIPRDIRVSLNEEIDSPKIEYACERARILARRKSKVVIWSTFVDTIELIASRLSDLGADYIHGGVDAGSELEEETRERKIKDFHLDPKKFVLVASPASCGEGISLHEICHHAIYVDRNFNAGQYLQSEDRIHRLGLPKNQRTTVEILISPGSVDESVKDRLNTKVRAMAAALKDPGLQIDPISLDPDMLTDDEAMDEADVQAVLVHLKKYA